MDKSFSVYTNPISAIWGILLVIAHSAIYVGISGGIDRHNDYPSLINTEYITDVSPLVCNRDWCFFCYIAFGLANMSEREREDLP